jgi:transposase
MATVARRHQALTAEITQLGTALETLLAHTAPAGFQTKTGVGTRVAATLLATAGDNPGRLRTEASSALWRIVFTRIATDPRTHAYLARRTSKGKTTREIIRCLNRYAAREIYKALTAHTRQLNQDPATPIIP